MQSDPCLRCSEYITHMAQNADRRERVGLRDRYAPSAFTNNLFFLIA